MISGLVNRTVIAVFLPVALGLAAIAETQEPDEKFVVFGREGDKECAWEYLPAGESEGLVKRCEFAPSPWSPWRLLGGKVPAFIRHQVPHESGLGHSVNLYRIDYSTWKVTTVLSSRQLSGLGCSDDVVYVKTDRGLRLVERKTGKVETPARPFERLHLIGDLWIVRYENSEAGQVRLFDPTRYRILKEFRLPEFASKKRFFRGPHQKVMALSPDHTLLAWVKPVAWDRAPKWGEPPRAAKTSLLLMDLETGKSRDLPFLIHVSPGAGIPHIYHGLDVWFTKDGDLKYYTAAREGAELKLGDDGDILEGEFEIVTVKHRSPVGFRKPVEAAVVRQHFAPKRTFFVPPWLKPDNPIKRRTDLLAEFLEHRGVAQAIRIKKGDRFRYNRYAVAWSPDSRRFLGAFPVQKGRRIWCFGDLEKDRLVEVSGGEAVKGPWIYWTEV